MTQQITDESFDAAPGTVEGPLAAVRPALTVAHDMGLTTDRVVQFDNLARVLGQSENLVRERFEQSVQERHARMLEEVPSLAAWVAEDENRAPLAVEDADAMTGFFSFIDTARKNVGALPDAWDRGKEPLTISELGGRYLAGDEKAPEDMLSFAEAAQERAKGRDSGLFVDAVWLTSAAEQLPRKLVTLVPAATEALATGLGVWGITTLAGGGAGAAVGSFIPGPGTAAGGLVGGAAAQPAAAAAGTSAAVTSYPFYASLQNYELEKNIFAYEMFFERDADGKPLDRDVIQTAAMVYGAVAGALEGFTEAGFLSLLKAGGAGKIVDSLGGASVKEAVKGAVKRMALDNVMRNRLAGLAGRVGMGALLEGGTEYLQEWAAIITGFLAKESGDQFFPGNEVFSTENAERALEAGIEGFKAGTWLRGAPIVASRLLNADARAEPEAFAEQNRELFKAVDGLALKAKSPDMTQELLESQGVSEEALIPGYEALRLYQDGMEALPDALGHSLEQIQNAAAKGQDVEVPVSRLVSRLDGAQFASVLDVARKTPESLSLADLRSDDAMHAETRRVLDSYRERQAAEADYVAAAQGLRESMALAVGETPGLKAQAEARAGGVDALVSDHMSALQGFAERHFTDAGQRARFLRSIDVQSELGQRLASDPQQQAEADEALAALVREADGLELPPDAGPLPDLADLGDMFTPKEYAKLQAQRALMQELGITPDMSQAQRARKLTPWLDAVWGRLDGSSLRRDYPDAFKAMVRNYGPGLFRSAEKGGLPVDYLAAELVEGNLFQDGTGASELVDKLTAPRGEGRRFFQPLNPDVDLDAPVRVVRVEPQFEGQEAWKLAKSSTSRRLKPLAGTYRNQQTGWDIALTRQGIAHAAGSVAKRSADHQAHMEAVANLPQLIENALLVETHQDRKDQGLIAVHRMYAGMQVENDLYTVKLTVKEHEGERRAEIEGVYRLYDSVIEKKTPDGAPYAAIPEGWGAHSTPDVFSTVTLRSLLEGVNDSEGQSFFQRGRKPGKGNVAIRPDGYTIAIGKHADLSTLVHESAHIFQEEMRRIEAAGMADERMLADMRTLNAWLARFDDDDALRAEYDKRLKGLPGFEKTFRKLSAEEKEFARDTAKREYFARGFEAYLREGAAPSEGLRAAFERFKTWLLTVYKHARSLGVELSDDVRGAFDRMLATEQEVEAAAAANELFALTKQQLDALGLTGADREYAANLMTSAKQRAATLTDQARNRDRNARRKTWAQEARADLLRMPVYAARAEIRSTGRHINAEALAALYGEEAAAMLRSKVGPGAVRKEGGQDPDIVAARHGFSDGAHMLRAIQDADSLTARITETVNAREAEHDAAIDPAAYLLQSEEAARQIELVGGYLARNLGRDGVKQQAIARAARESLLDMPMGKARSHKSFAAAMSRALKRERAATARGDFAAAFAANTQARLNLEFTRQALDIAERQQRTEREIRRFARMKKADPDARYTVNDIGMRYILAKYDARLGEGRNADTIRAWVQGREEDGYPMHLDETVLYGVGRDWREASLAEFENVADTVNQIIAVERNTRKLLTDANKAEFAAVERKLVETVHTYREAKPIKLIEEESFIPRGLRKAHAFHTKIEALCIALDGGKPLGNNWSRIYKPINDAANRRGQYYKALRDRLQSKTLFGAYSEKELAAMAHKKAYVPELGESITRGQRIMMALNMGNDGNYRRMQRGGGYTDAQIRAAVSSLDRRDWTFVQGIWDTFEGYKEEAFALQEEVAGLRPSAVEARPLTVALPDGDSMSLRGGYFPVIYNRKHAGPDLSDKLLGGDSPSFAMTRQGHLKERTATGAGTPLDYNLAGIVRSLNDVITDITFRKAHIDVGRTLRSRAYRRAVESTVGPEMYQAMVAWLKDAARENRVRTAGENWLRWGRTSSTIMAMGFKVTTMLTQPIGFTQTIEQIGWADAAQGLNMAYGGGMRGFFEMRDWVRSVSPMMAQRMTTYDRDVTDATADFARQELTPGTLLDSVTPSGLLRVEKWLKKNAFVPMAAFQYGVDLPTWLGAHAKGLRDFGGSDIQARDYADSIVRLSQGSGQAKDLAHIQRGPEFLKAATMFYSYFSTLYNLTAARVSDVHMNRDAASALRAANSFLLLVAVPAVLSELVAGRGPEDDEDFLSWAAKQVLLYPTQAIVLIRDLVRFVEGRYGYSVSPAVDAPEAIYRYLSELYKLAVDPDKELDVKRLGKLTLRTYGYMKGLPLRQAEISAFNVLDAMDGSSDFELRDLMYVRPQDRR